MELVVAAPHREHDQRTPVVERNPRGLVDDLPVDVRPEQPGGVGRAGLGGEGLPELLVYPGLQNSLSFRLVGLPGMKEWQLKSGPKKSQGAG